jgi:glycine cleavage system regulatory protein
MGVGDKPQVLLAASGVHTPTVVRDLTAALYELGGSVAATKKVVLGDHYSLLMSVWLPDKNEPAEAAAVLKEAFDKNFSALSTNLTLYPLDGGAAAAGAVCDEVVTRRLRVSCPQKPGVVLAITRLLQVVASVHHSPARDSAAGSSTPQRRLACSCSLGAPGGAHFAPICAS